MRALPSANRTPERRAVESADFASIGIAKRPVHLMVADAASRTRSASAPCHVATSLPPTGLFVRAGDGL